MPAINVILFVQELREVRDSWIRSAKGAYYGESGEEAAEEAGRIRGKESAAEELDEVLRKYGVDK